MSKLELAGKTLVEDDFIILGNLLFGLTKSLEMIFWLAATAGLARQDEWYWERSVVPERDKNLITAQGLQ